MVENKDYYLVIWEGEDEFLSESWGDEKIFDDFKDAKAYCESCDEYSDEGGYYIYKIKLEKLRKDGN